MIQDGQTNLKLQSDGDANVVLRIDGQSSIQYNYSDIPLYEGEYIFTPSDNEQIVQIADHKASANIVINPIPSNYGKVTWNGYELHIE